MEKQAKRYHFEVDTHTHTLASGHAYNTINEMAEEASRRGVKLMAITEHAPNMPGSCSEFYFLNLKVVPRQKYGVELLMGVEANIIDFDGTLDLAEQRLKEMDIVIASAHTPCLVPGSREENTRAYLKAIHNPYVNIIGHPDDNRYPIDREIIVKEAKACGVAIELNNSSLSPMSFRKHAIDNQRELLRLCKQYEAPIVLGSDAHEQAYIMDFQYIEPLLQEIDFPDELILNTSTEKLKNFLALHHFSVIE